jgi:hypothetical protein
LLIPLADHLARVCRFLPPSLVSPGALKRIEALPRVLPAALPPMRHSIFECRLSTSAGRKAREQVDLAWKYRPQALAGLAASWRQAGSGEDGGGAPTWRMLARFAEAFDRDAPSPLREVHLVGLELDLDRSPDEATLPALFFCFGLCDRAKTAGVLDVLLTIFEQEIEEEEIQEQEIQVPATWRRCVDALPDGAGVNYLGLMLGRPGNAVRLGIEQIRPQERILPYLDAIGWTGDRGALAGFLRGLPAALATSAPVVAIDVGEHVEGRIGLEFLLAHDGAVSGDHARVLLDHLVHRGLCRPEARDGMLAWPSSPRAPAPSWYERFAGGRRGNVDDEPERFTSHVKIVVDPTGELEAKGYLEATTGPRA